jgi:hypothetical protein
MIERADEAPDNTGNYSAQLRGHANGSGDMLMAERADCPHADISVPNTPLSMVVWFKHSDADENFAGIDNFGHAAGNNPDRLSLENEKNRFSVFFRTPLVERPELVVEKWELTTTE